MARVMYRSGWVLAVWLVASSATNASAAADGADRAQPLRDRLTGSTAVDPRTQGVGGPDSDGDGVADVIDPNPGNPLICGDYDGDTCDDCSVTGGPPDPANDGPDSDGDGVCDAGECPCNTDVNGDSVINVFDVIIVLECTRGIPNPACDINCDGAQNQCDLDAVLCAFNGFSDCCNQACGACCVNGTACVVASQSVCESGPPFGAGGVFQGPATTCGTQNAAIFPEPGGQVFVHVIGPPVQCPAPVGPAPAAGCTPGVFIDAWVSPPDGQMCHNFGVPGSPPIPPGFFDPGSDPFTGQVCFAGEPLGPTPFGEFGSADTLIRRTADPFDRCALPGLEIDIPIEIVALNLHSVQPIIVTFNGGMNPQPWNVRVDLSTFVTPPMGNLTVQKTHCNGGVYTSTLLVQPRFTFSNPDVPSNEPILDTGQAGIPPVVLQQDQPAPWVSDIDPNLGYQGDMCTDFHPGVQEPDASTDCDCQGNGLRDQCEIDGGLPDTNANGTPDECESAACCLGDGGCVVATGLTCPGFPGTIRAPGTLCDEVNCDVQPCDDDGDCDDDNACTYDDCAFSTCSNAPSLYGDIDGVTGVDIFDILCVLDAFAGVFDTCSLNNVDLAPCPNGDGICDVFDILAVLDGFAGEQGCCAP